MLDNEEYAPCVNPKISAVLNEIGVGKFRSESFWDVNPENSQDGKVLILNGLFTLNSSGILNNVPLNPSQVTILMESMKDQNVVYLDLSGNKFDDKTLLEILTNLPKSVKTLNLHENNFTTSSIKLLKDFSNNQPNCIVRVDEYKYDATISHNTSEILVIDTLDFTVKSVALGENQSSTSQSEYDPQA